MKQEQENPYYNGKILHAMLCTILLLVCLVIWNVTIRFGTMFVYAGGKANVLPVQNRPIIHCVHSFI